MALYRRKPTTIEAVLWNGRAVANVPTWLSDAIGMQGAPDKTPGCAMRIGDEIHLGTRQGAAVCRPGDWIMKGDGELYPCAPDVFERTYEEATDAAL